MRPSKKTIQIKETTLEKVTPRILLIPNYLMDIKESKSASTGYSEEKESTKSTDSIYSLESIQSSESIQSMDFDKDSLIEYVEYSYSSNSYCKSFHSFCENEIQDILSHSIISDNDYVVERSKNPICFD